MIHSLKLLYLGAHWHLAILSGRSIDYTYKILSSHCKPWYALEWTASIEPSPVIFMLYGYATAY